MTAVEHATTAVATKPKCRVDPKSILMRGKLIRQKPKQPMRWDEYEVVK